MKNSNLRYSQSKEKSAELLRMVLGHMGQHDAAFNPLTFTVWFEYAAGMNKQLNQAVDERLQSQPRLGDADLLNLYQLHVAEVDPQAMHRIGSELQRVMQSLGDKASLAGGQAGEFGVQLETLVSELLGANNKLAIPAVAKVIEGSARMRSSAQALESEVKVNQLEIQRLQGELARVRDESLLDALTQVLNRKGFEQKLASMLEQPVGPGRSHWLVMFDLDHFKKVNDTHGHVMGDRVLQALGEVLRSCVPANSGISAARYGGEEFSMLMPDTTQQECSKLAELVRTRTKALKIRDRRTQVVVLTVTVSGGMASMHAGDDAQTLTARADAALYRSKQAGRDRITGD
ncbi:MAG: GGDEF domain-containing protein [Comamonadaceae bacterium]|nr:GGDEF domain-containing protein [Comamonadaceae bacterium]